LITAVKFLQGRRRALLVVMGLLVVGGVVLWIAWPRIQTQRRWHEVQLRGVLRIGIDPGVRDFSFFGRMGWEGYDAGVANEIASRLGLSVEAVPVGYDGFYDALSTRRVDIAMSALVPDSARTRDAVYSDSYFDAGVRLIGVGRQGIQGTATKDVPDLANARVVAVLGSDADRLARWLERRTPGLNRTAALDVKSALAMIRIGTSDWALIDARDAIGSECNPVITAMQATLARASDCVSLQPQPYVIAAGNEDAQLIHEINHALHTMQTDGALNRIAAKWFAQKGETWNIDLLEEPA
jgi:ABC-type amino acid transport substrate-binding protein